VLRASAVFWSDDRNSGNIRQICITMGRGQVYARGSGLHEPNECGGMAVGQHMLAVRLAAAVGHRVRCTRGF
jgi:hypothetical protein